MNHLKRQRPAAKLSRAAAITVAKLAALLLLFYFFPVPVHADGDTAYATQTNGLSFRSGVRYAASYFDAAGQIHTLGRFHFPADFAPGDDVFAPFDSADEDTWFQYNSCAFQFLLDANYTWAGGHAIHPYPELTFGARFSPFAFDVNAQGDEFACFSLSGTVDADWGPGELLLTSMNSPTYDFDHAVLTKYDASGALVYCFKPWDHGGKHYQDIAAGPSGDLVLLADPSLFASPEGLPEFDADPGPGTFMVQWLRNGNQFAESLLTKLAADGSLAWATAWFMNATDPRPDVYGASATVTKIAVSNQGDIFAAGIYTGTADLDPGPNSHPVTGARPGPAGAVTALLVKLNASGEFVWGRVAQPGDTVDENGAPTGIGALIIDDILVDPQGCIYISGAQHGTVDLDFGSGVHYVTQGSLYDRVALLAKYSSNGDLLWTHPVPVGQEDTGGVSDKLRAHHMAVDPAGYTYFSANYAGSIDADPGPAEFPLETEYIPPHYDEYCAFVPGAYNWEVYVSKFDPQGNFLWANTTHSKGISNPLMKLYTQRFSLSVDALGNAALFGTFLEQLRFGGRLPSPTLYREFVNGPMLVVDGAPPRDGFLWILDTTPRVTLTSTSPEHTYTAPIPVDAIFQEPVNGFEASDIQMAGASIANFQGNGRHYTFDVIPNSPQALVTVTIPDNVTVDDLDNPNEGGSLTRHFDSVQAGASLTCDASPYVHGAVQVTCTLSETVGTLVAASFALQNADIDNFSGSGTQYTFTLVPASEGPFRVSLSAGTCTDEAGNPNAASNTIERIFDVTAPELTLSADAKTVVNGPLALTISASEAVIGLTANKIATLNAVVSNFSGVGTAYTFTLTPVSDGPFSASILAGKCTDLAGNPNLASNTLERTRDLPPAIALNSDAPDTVLSSSGIDVTVMLSEGSPDFSAACLTMQNAVANHFSGSGTAYTFKLYPLNPGPFSVRVLGGMFTDATGNWNDDSNVLQRTYAPGSITLANPGVAYAGAPLLLRWTSSLPPETVVRIELWRKGKLARVIAKSTPNDGKLKWKVPAGIKLADGYTLRIVALGNAPIADTTDTPFRIARPPSERT